MIWRLVSDVNPFCDLLHIVFSEYEGIPVKNTIQDHRAFFEEIFNSYRHVFSKEAESIDVYRLASRSGIIYYRKNYMTIHLPTCIL